MRRGQGNAGGPGGCGGARGGPCCPARGRGCAAPGAGRAGTRQLSRGAPRGCRDGVGERPGPAAPATAGPGPGPAPGPRLTLGAGAGQGQEPGQGQGQALRQVLPAPLRRVSRRGEPAPGSPTAPGTGARTGAWTGAVCAVGGAEAGGDSGVRQQRPAVSRSRWVPTGRSGRGLLPERLQNPRPLCSPTSECQSRCCPPTPGAGSGGSARPRHQVAASSRPLAPTLAVPGVPQRGAPSARRTRHRGHGCSRAGGPPPRAGRRGLGRILALPGNQAGAWEEVRWWIDDTGGTAMSLLGCSGDPCPASTASLLGIRCPWCPPGAGHRFECGDSMGH